jgi:hypothetical protein
VSHGVGSGSYSTGEDGDGETRPNSRGLRGVWPNSPQMADGGGSGGVRQGPELLGHCRWTGGIEGGVEERTRHAGVDERDVAKKRDGRRPMPFMAARWRGGEKGAGECKVEGGLGGELPPRGAGRRWKGGGSGTGEAHNKGGARRSRKSGATGSVACGRCGRQRSGAACVGYTCRHGPTGEGRELGRACEQQCRF